MNYYEKFIENFSNLILLSQKEGSPLRSLYIEKNHLSHYSFSHESSSQQSEVMNSFIKDLREHLYYQKNITITSHIQNPFIHYRMTQNFVNLIYYPENNLSWPKKRVPFKEFKTIFNLFSPLFSDLTFFLNQFPSFDSSDPQELSLQSNFLHTLLSSHNSYIYSLLEISDIKSSIHYELEKLTEFISNNESPVFIQGLHQYLTNKNPYIKEINSLAFDISLFSFVKSLVHFSYWKEFSSYFPRLHHEHRLQEHPIIERSLNTFYQLNINQSSLSKVCPHLVLKTDRHAMLEMLIDSIKSLEIPEIISITLTQESNIIIACSSHQSDLIQKIEDFITSVLPEFNQPDLILRSHLPQEIEGKQIYLNKIATTYWLHVNLEQKEEIKKPKI